MGIVKKVIQIWNENKKPMLVALRQLAPGLVVGLLWAAFNAYNSPVLAWPVFLKDLIAALFMVTWFTGQFVRVKNQTGTETRLKKLATTLEAQATHLQGIGTNLDQARSTLAIETKRLQDTLSGGESFPEYAAYTVSGQESRGFQWFAEHHGEYPINVLSLEIKDIQRLQNYHIRKTGSPYWGDRIPMSYLHPERSIHFDFWSAFDGRTYFEFTIITTAVNASLYQSYVLQQDGEGWQSATCIKGNFISDPKPWVTRELFRRDPLLLLKEDGSPVRNLMTDPA